MKNGLEAHTQVWQLNEVFALFKTQRYSDSALDPHLPSNTSVLMRAPGLKLGKKKPLQMSSQRFGERAGGGGEQGLLLFLYLPCQS